MCVMLTSLGISSAGHYENPSSNLRWHDQNCLFGENQFEYDKNDSKLELSVQDFTGNE